MRVPKVQPAARTPLRPSEKTSSRRTLNGSASRPPAKVRRAGLGMLRRLPHNGSASTPPAKVRRADLGVRRGTPADQPLLIIRHASSSPGGRRCDASSCPHPTAPRLPPDRACVLVVRPFRSLARSLVSWSFVVRSSLVVVVGGRWGVVGWLFVVEWCALCVVRCPCLKTQHACAAPTGGVSHCDSKLVPNA